MAEEITIESLANSRSQSVKELKEEIKVLLGLKNYKDYQFDLKRLPGSTCLLIQVIATDCK